MDILEGLNQPQKSAVLHETGPLLILAGAGSGKTKTLTHRIAYLISNSGISPNQIMAVTFTNKAAREMRERLGRLLGQDSENQAFMGYMGTFHSISVRLLRQYGENIGVPKNFVILDESDKQSLIKQVMCDELHITDKQYSPSSMASYISSAKNDCLGPKQYAHVAHTPAQKIAAEVYPRYEKMRKSGKALDFDDLLLEVVNLLEKTPVVRKELQQRFRHILIDEYQDTNKAQYKMVKLLANTEQNICAVGDDWQSIYSWRGADFTNILNFERDFPGAKIIKLEENYRSTQAILDAAHMVIQHNTQRTDKNLFTNKKGGSPVQILSSQNQLHEGEILVNHIQPSVELGARKYSDFAVLYRTNAQSRAIEEVFMRYGLPYKIVGGTRFYDRAEIKDVLAYLKLIYQPYDRASFLRVVNVPRRGLGDTSVAKFMTFVDENNLDFISAMNSPLLDAIVPARACKNFQDLGIILGSFQDPDIDKPQDLVRLVKALLKKIKYLEYLDDGSLQAEGRIENVNELMSVAKEFNTLPEFLEEVALVSNADTSADGDAVTLMTLHAAKGLEFPVVFMVGMEEGLFPLARATFDASELEEERRLCYVGMTRAREELILTNTTSRLLYGNYQYNLPSRFLSDIDDETMAKSPNNLSTSVVPSKRSEPGDIPMPNGGDPVARSAPLAGKTGQGYDVEKSFGDFAEPRYVPDEIELSVGDKVRHKIFGNGKVVDIDGSIVSVKFGSSTKKLNVAFAPLTVIDGE